MALITCPDCGKSISDAAPTCPNCGRPVAAQHLTASRREETFGPEPPKKGSVWTKPIGGGGLLILVAILIAVGYCSGPTTSSRRSSEPSTWSTPRYSTTAVNILREYDQNEVAADAKYRGKVIKVSGAIEDIDTSLSNAPVIELAGEDWHTLRCYFERDTPQLGTIINMRKGQAVTLVCIGGSVGISPTMKNCRVE